MMRLVLPVLFTLVSAGNGIAACPQGLAVYEGVDGIGELNFLGGAGPNRQVNLLFADVAPIATYVSPSYLFGRAEMVIPLNCPEGDVTGAELEACVVYSSALYAINRAGDIAPLPEDDETAAEQILLPNLAAALWQNKQFEGEGPASHPAEIFKLSGCQE